MQKELENVIKAIGKEQLKLVAIVKTQKESIKEGNLYSNEPKKKDTVTNRIEVLESAYWDLGESKQKLQAIVDFL